MKSPQFPGILSIPLKILPSTVHSRLMVKFLNLLLTEPILDGELDFLNNKKLSIKVCDADVTYLISLKNKKLVAINSGSKNDIELQANIYDYLQLAARQEDPDTLVFQRKLIMQGNTELGLQLKNFLDGLDLESRNSFAKLEALLIKALPVYKRLFQ